MEDDLHIETDSTGMPKISRVKPDGSLEPVPVGDGWPAPLNQPPAKPAPTSAPVATPASAPVGASFHALPLKSGVAVALQRVVNGVQVTCNGERVLLLRDDGYLVQFQGLSRRTGVKRKTSDGSNRMAVRDAASVDDDGNDY